MGFGSKNVPDFGVNFEKLLAFDVRNFKAAETPDAVLNFKIWKIVRNISVASKSRRVNKVAFNHRRNKVEFFVEFHVIWKLSTLFVNGVHGFSHSVNHGVAVYRLGKIFKGPKTHGFLGILKFIKGTQNYDDRIRLWVHYVTHRFKTVKSRHVYVHKNYVNLIFCDDFQGFTSACSRKKLNLLGKILV